MKKRELLRLLDGFGDDDEILVESLTGGFEEPVIYVAAIRARRHAEMTPGSSSEYVADRDGGGMVVLGTHQGCVTL